MSIAIPKAEPRSPYQRERLARYLRHLRAQSSANNILIDAGYGPISALQWLAMKCRYCNGKGRYSPAAPDCPKCKGRGSYGCVTLLMREIPQERDGDGEFVTHRAFSARVYIEGRWIEDETRELAWSRTNSHFYNGENEQEIQRKDMMRLAASLGADV